MDTNKIFISDNHYILSSEVDILIEKTKLKLINPWEDKDAIIAEISEYDNLHDRFEQGHFDFEISQSECKFGVALNLLSINIYDNRSK